MSLVSSVSTIPRVGYWWSEKKSRKFNVNEFIKTCWASGLELVKIDLECPLEKQGPFTAIVHKLSDAVVKAEQGDLHSKAVCQAFQDYVDSHPDVVIIDPLPNIEKLLDRYRQYKLVQDSELQKEGDLQSPLGLMQQLEWRLRGDNNWFISRDSLHLRGSVFIPAFVELTTTNVKENLKKLKAAGVSFPCVCKPSLAHGSSFAHQMCLIFNEESLKDINPPCVAQKFVNHNAVLYKLFIIGDKYFIIERPSLKNFSAGDHETIFFDSHDISKPHSASALTELDGSEPKSPIIWPEKEQMDHIVQVLCERLGLALFGIDVIVDNKTGHYAIIDMNIFPGYDEVENFFQILCDLIVTRISSQANGISRPIVCRPTLANNSWFPASKAKSGCKKVIFEPLSKFKDGTPSAVIPYSENCFCCPITGFCNNTLSLSSDFQVSHQKHLHKNTLVHNICFKGLNIKPTHCSDILVTKLLAADINQDDSGIDTSDSCDEKKKETALRTVKRQHSRNYVTSTVALDESG